MVSCPLLFPPVNIGSPAAEGGNFPPPWARRFLRRQTAALFGLHLLGNPL